MEQSSRSSEERYSTPDSFAAKYYTYEQVAGTWLTAMGSDEQFQDYHERLEQGYSVLNPADQEGKDQAAHKIDRLMAAATFLEEIRRVLRKTPTISQISGIVQGLTAGTDERAVDFRQRLQGGIDVLLDAGGTLNTSISTKWRQASSKTNQSPEDLETGRQDQRAVLVDSGSSTSSGTATFGERSESPRRSRQKLEGASIVMESIKAHEKLKGGRPPPAPQGEPPKSRLRLRSPPSVMASCVTPIAPRTVYQASHKSDYPAISSNSSDE